MTIHGKITERGRVVIPLNLRETLGLNPGEPIVFREHNGALLIISLNQTIEQIQDVAQQRLQGVSLVDELLSTRRADVEKETKPQSEDT